MKTLPTCKSESRMRKLLDWSKSIRRSSIGSRRQNSFAKRCSLTSRRQRLICLLWTTSNCRRPLTWPSCRIISLLQSLSISQSRPRFWSLRTTRWSSRLRPTSVRLRSTRKSRKSWPSALISVRKSSSVWSKSLLKLHQRMHSLLVTIWEVPSLLGPLVWANLATTVLQIQCLQVHLMQSSLVVAMTWSTSWSKNSNSKKRTSWWNSRSTTCSCKSIKACKTSSISPSKSTREQPCSWLSSSMISCMKRPTSCSQTRTYISTWKNWRRHPSRSCQRKTKSHLSWSCLSSYSRSSRRKIWT